MVLRGLAPGCLQSSGGPGVSADWWPGGLLGERLYTHPGPSPLRLRSAPSPGSGRPHCRGSACSGRRMALAGQPAASACACVWGLPSQPPVDTHCCPLLFRVSVPLPGGPHPSPCLTVQSLLRCHLGLCPWVLVEVPSRAPSFLGSVLGAQASMSLNHPLRQQMGSGGALASAATTLVSSSQLPECL